MFFKKGKEKIHQSLGIQSLELCISLRRTRLWNKIYDQGKGAILIKTVNQIRASLVAQLVKSLPEMQETRVLVQGRENSLEKEIATHSSSLAWRIPWAVEPGRL